MKSVACLALVVVCVALAEAFPAGQDDESLPVYFVRAKRSPARIMMLSGFYTRPASRRQGYVGEIPAPVCKSCGGDIEEQQVIVDDEEPKLEYIPQDAPLPETPADEDAAVQEDGVADDDDEDDLPVKKPGKKGKNGPSVNTYFPIQFGSVSRATAGTPGVIAIANSFSTGRKGVAKSVATAHGN